MATDAKRVTEIQQLAAGDLKPLINTSMSKIFQNAIDNISKG